MLKIYEVGELIACGRHGTIHIAKNDPNIIIKAEATGHRTLP
jgi:hypothetical protein